MRFITATVLALCSILITACNSPASSSAEAIPDSPEQIAGRPDSLVTLPHRGNSDSEQLKDAEPASDAHANDETHAEDQAAKTAGPLGHSGRGHSPSHGSHHAPSHDTQQKKPHGNHSSKTHGNGKSKPPGNHIAIGEKVPDFEVAIAGKNVKLSELQKDSKAAADGTVVLTFWCSFCHSCRHVEKELDKLASKFQGRAAVIALDASAGETMEDVEQAAKKQGLTLPIALDASGKSADIFGTRVTTTTVVIDKQGVLRYRGQFRDRNHAFAEDALNAVLADKKVAVSETRQRG